MNQNKWRIKKQLGLWYLYEPYAGSSLCRGTFNTCVVTFASVQKFRLQDSKRWRDG